MTKTRDSVLVFDLDGTIVDTAPDLVDTLNEILQREGLAPEAFEKVRETIGFGSRAMLRRAYEARGLAFVPPLSDRLSADFIAHYADNIARKSRPFPGLEAALDRLSGDFTFAVCTNKLEWLAVKLLDAIGLSQRFSFVCGQDTFGFAKPDPRVLMRTIAAAGGDASRSIMVGDSNTDILTARAAGIPVIAVDFGYTDVPIASCLPDTIIGHFDDLDRAVADILAGIPAREA